MISIQQNGQVYEIQFPYDPTVIEMVKGVPGKRWHGEAKMWTIPAEHLGFFLNQLKASVYASSYTLVSDEHIDENADLETTQVIPDIDLRGVRFYVEEGSKPYPHQLDYMRYALDRQMRNNFKGFLCADEMGLGKTIESFNLAAYNYRNNHFKRCLIICCVNSGKHNWINDITKHTNGQAHPYMLGTRIKKRRGPGFRPAKSTKEKYEDLQTLHMYGDKSQSVLPLYIVTNIETLRYKEGRKHPVTDRIIELIQQGHISTIIVDEIHKNASPTSQQGKQLLKIKKETGNKAMWLPLTGTPITKKPTDLYTPMTLVGVNPYSSYYSWCQHFCIYGGFGGHEVIGYRNIPELKKMLESNMIRRKSEEVLDLPDKIFYDEMVENTSAQQSLYEDVEQDIIAHKGEIIQNLNPVTRFLRLRQVNGSPELVDNVIDPGSSDYLSRWNAKMYRIMDLLEQYIDENGEKVLIFSNWVEPLRTLYRFVSKKYKTCCYTGTMKESDREDNKARFQNDPSYTVMLGTIGAMGTTHTLTAASAMIFLDEPWNPSDLDQAIKRANRIGSTKALKIHTLISEDTVDQRVHEILSTKAAVSQYIVDGQLDLHKNPELFDLLLSHNK